MALSPQKNEKAVEKVEPKKSVALTDEELIAWIHQNIDFGKLDDKMDAMPIIVSSLDGKVTPERVKQILQDM